MSWNSINRLVINMVRVGYMGVFGFARAGNTRVCKGVCCHVFFCWPLFQCHFHFLVIHKNLDIGDALVKHTLSLLSADTHRCKQREESISVNTFWVCSSRRDLQYDSIEHESARPWTLTPSSTSKVWWCPNHSASTLGGVPVWCLQLFLSTYCLAFHRCSQEKPQCQDDFLLYQNGLTSLFTQLHKETRWCSEINC